MDSWSQDQLRKMQCGGNGKLNSFLKLYNIDKSLDIKEKYNSKAAEVGVQAEPSCWGRARVRRAGAATYPLTCLPTCAVCGTPQFARERLRADVEGREYTPPPPSAVTSSSSPAMSKAASAAHLPSAGASARNSPGKRHDDWGDWGDSGGGGSGASGAGGGGRASASVRLQQQRCVSMHDDQPVAVNGMHGRPAPRTNLSLADCPVLPCMSG